MSDPSLESLSPNEPCGRPSAEVASKEIAAPIRVLILEDRPEDAELVAHELRRSWFDPDWRRLETEEEFIAALRLNPDIILSDYRMPQLDASHALKLVQDLGLDIPFIVVSGAIGEDAAVAMMRQGASDYLLKDRLRRLGPAVRRALAEKRLREEKRSAEQALGASETRFYSFMNHSPALALIKDAQGRILYTNNTCEQAWNMSLSHCEGKLDIDLWPRDEAARLRAEDLSVLNSGVSSRMVEGLTTKQGDSRHLLTYRFPFDDATGSRILGVVSMDITERIGVERALAAALHAKETLLKEVHHRVKNNLQIISSLLNMQCDLIAEPAQRDVFAESQRRVQAMAMIHERLCSQDDLDHVEFGAYVEALIQDLLAAHGADPRRIRLRLQLERVSLELNQAIPCALILNELVSNALKYAFPGDRSGELLVELSCDEERVTLRVSDDGVGIQDNRDSKHSLGLGIVSVLAQQLSGKLTRSSNPGVGFCLTFARTPAEVDLTHSYRKTSSVAG